MIKFFRKIRQNLLKDRKFKNYLVYAIGEIILVVLGILIALQINTANQNRQRAKLEKVLLSQVQEEILNIYSDLRYDAKVLEQGEISHYNILKHFQEDRPYPDSLCFDFYWLQKDEYVYPMAAAYGRLKDQGMDIIKNDSIANYLRGLHESSFPRLRKSNSWKPDISKVYNEFYLENFKPNDDFSLQHHFHVERDTLGGRIYGDINLSYLDSIQQFNSQSSIGYVPLDFNALKKDSKFKMLMEQTKSYRDFKLGRYYSAKYLIEELVPMIGRALE